jgi:formamidase
LPRAKPWCTRRATPSTDNSTAEDVGNLDLNVVHPLTGPVFVKGAEAGDLLEVELVAVEADPWEQWGYTVEVPGFGFLRDEFPEPYIIHWRLHGNEYAESEQLPGVRIRCNPHPGVLGLAPSAELRQRAAAERGGFALPPSRAAPCRPKRGSPGRRSGPSRRARRPGM